MLLKTASHEPWAQLLIKMALYYKSYILGSYTFPIQSPNSHPPGKRWASHSQHRQGRDDWVLPILQLLVAM